MSQLIDRWNKLRSSERLVIIGFFVVLWLYTGWRNAEQHDAIAQAHGWDPKHLSAEQRQEVDQQYDDDREEDRE